MNDHRFEHVLENAQTKSNLHRAIDALPDGAKAILIANACCCGTPHGTTTEGAVYHAAHGGPTLTEALGLLRMAEHHLIANAFDEPA